MTDEKKPADPKPDAEDKAASDHKITRRRFTKAGLAAPVIMTLAPRAVFGQGPCAGIGSVMASVDPSAASVSTEVKTAIDNCESCINTYKTTCTDASPEDALAACEADTLPDSCPGSIAGTDINIGGETVNPILENSSKKNDLRIPPGQRKK
jgi:hypothetical protein